MSTGIFYSGRTVDVTLHGGRGAAAATVRREFGAKADRALALYGLQPGGTPVDDPRLGDVTLQLANDVTFRCPVIAVSKALSARGVPVWQYQYDYNPPDGSAVTHASEVRYVFDSPATGLEASAPPLQAYWLNFVKTGDPNGGSLPRWPSYAAGTRSYLSFTNAGPIAARGLRDAICGLRDTP